MRIIASEKAWQQYYGRRSEKFHDEETFVLARASVAPIVVSFFLNEATLNNEYVHACNHLLAIAVFEWIGLDLTANQDHPPVFNFDLETFNRLYGHRTTPPNYLKSDKDIQR